MDDLDGKASKSNGIIREPPDIRLVNEKWGLRDGSDSEHNFEANSRHEGCKRHATITPTNIGVSLEMTFLMTWRAVRLDRPILMR